MEKVFKNAALAGAVALSIGACDRGDSSVSGIRNDVASYVNRCVNLPIEEQAAIVEKFAPGYVENPGDFKPTVHIFAATSPGHRIKNHEEALSKMESECDRIEGERFRVENDTDGAY